jgi:hypothetical protein
MMVGASEGHGFRYEIVEITEGFLVRMRDLDTGSLDESEALMFRTAAVAFAYAEMSAAFDRYAAARIGQEEADELLAELEGQQALYGELSRRLGDDGLAAHLLVAWEEEAASAKRRRLH